MSDTGKRRLAVITGGCGGMGIACAREFGKTQDLLLADISGDRLEATAANLTDEGYKVVRCVAGDLAAPSVIAKICEGIDAHGPLGTVIHTAGVSSGLAEWQVILRTNVLGTRRLLDAVEDRLAPGTVGILVASVAGYLASKDPDVDALLASATTDDFVEEMESHLRRLAGLDDDPSSWANAGAGSLAYALSKRATIRFAASRSAAWAKKGARIVSISPGIIWTPMGRHELEHGKSASRVLADTPLQRCGTAMDIAEAAAFLASDRAGFITGIDLRVDGGMISSRLGQKL